jgi:epoxide hydrolase-like predicted phosphatase
MAVKNIILDFGGVLLNIDYQLTEKAFIDLGCKNFHAMYSQAQQSDLFNSFETGKITEQTFIKEVKTIAGLQERTDDEIKQAWDAMLIDFPKKNYDLLKELKKKYHVFLLSNTNETHINAFEKLIKQTCPLPEFIGLFEKVYYSCRMHLRKPNVECFLEVLKESNLNPEETIFIDDSAQHLEGAKEAGITAYWLKKGVDTTSLVKEIGLL